MAPASPANANAPRLSAERVFDLVRAHLRQPLVLVHAPLILESSAAAERDPTWIVGELLRLALIGATAEGEHPDASVSLVLEFAEHLLERGR